MKVSLEDENAITTVLNPFLFNPGKKIPIIYYIKSV